MTTITFKDNTMAADSRITQGDRILGTKQKIYNTKEYIIGAAGLVEDIERFVNWITTKHKNAIFPEKIEERNSVDCLVYSKKEKQLYFFGGSPIPIVIQADFYAIGSGSSYALGAMEAGADAEEAIVIASKFDTNTDSNVQVVRV